MATNTVLSDKMAVLQVLGSLSKKPVLFSDREYKLSVDDFPEQFHKIVFGAIEHLGDGGAEHVDAIDVDQFLKAYPSQYKVFCDNRGVEYVMRAQNVAEEKNFKYYYILLKKYSLLNRMRAEGFDIKEIYDETLTDPRDITKMRDRFNALTLNDILDSYSGKLITLKQDYGKTEGIIETKAGDFLKELLKKFKSAPDIGLPMVSPKLTTIFRGRRLGKFFLESAASGMGKTRRMIGEACKVAVPYIYDLRKKDWVTNSGACKENVLYISTELSPVECETLFGAYLAGIPEDIILDGKFNDEEWARLNRAADILNGCNLHFVQLTNFDVNDIENTIRKYHYLYKVNYVFYDYLSVSPKILSEGATTSKMSNLQEYQVLYMFAQRMKDLSTILDIHIQSATQLNGDWKTAKEADQNLLRGAKSIADKIDVGAILMPVREYDKDLIDAYMTRVGFGPRPNAVIHIYKVRQNKFNNVRLYVYFDKSTCRLEDCFCADYSGQVLEVDDTNVETVLKQTESKEILGVNRELEQMSNADLLDF